MPSFLSKNGPNQTPFCFFSLASLCPNPNAKENELDSIILEVSRNGEKGQVGDLLQRKNHSSGGRDNSVDKVRPNRNMGGCFELELTLAWKNLFPLMETSEKLGFVPMNDEAWCITSNPW